ncbi:BrnT family toxin [Sphingobium boeckii]|uniref:BrnT family toxin n=1 Tax=Sphingobium boeckii TaxID=1082345 RepID=A0A7W9AIH6_9SPHN|nr:BrnT family toxin [Sphingobium boeckii]MBB5686188.1 hypothetical protein [Sphingobium boeckii]
MFVYDPAKSATNKVKHGVDFEEAQALWDDPYAIEVPSVQSVMEPRWLVIGAMSARLWTAIITRRDDTIRIISVRRARDYEEKAYERSQQN